MSKLTIGLELYSVYCITNTENGRRYIGQSNAPFARFAKHLSQLRMEADDAENVVRHHSQEFVDDFRKYGASAFAFSILRDGIRTKDAALKAEAELIEQYGSVYNKHNTAPEHKQKTAEMPLYTWPSVIKGVLHEKRIKQFELADEMGVSPCHVSSVLHGHIDPPGEEARMRDAIMRILARRYEANDA